MIDPRVVQIVGDGSSGRWLTWRWADGVRPGGVHRVESPDSLAAELRAALPRASAALEDLALDGPLTSQAGELELMKRLADGLLPPILRQQLLRCHEDGERLQVRVMPSPQMAAVPWGLLPIDGPNLRLLDVADVSWIGPMLPRDVRPDGERRAWDDVRDLRPLHVLDPETGKLDPVTGKTTRRGLGAVLNGPPPLCRCHGDAAPAVAGHSFTRGELSERLRGGVSRVLLVGHCVASEASPGDTAFVMSDVAKPDDDGHGPRIKGYRALAAADLLRGTVDGSGARQSGGERWPMPPRVGLVACASGADLTDREPLGLATAMLMNGADTVQATLWTLPTDYALAQRGAAGAFAELVRAVDHSQSADDPVAELCAWQRGCLDAWRADPSLANSPLLWGSAMTITAPIRSLTGQPVR